MEAHVPGGYYGPQGGDLLLSGTISREPTACHALCPELRGGVSVGVERSG